MALKIPYRIDYTKIDSDLEYFPVDIFISRNSIPSFVYDSLFNLDNKPLKFKMLDSTKTKELPAEVSYYDYDKKEMIIHTRVPNVSSSSVTYVYMEILDSDSGVYTGLTAEAYTTDFFPHPASADDDFTGEDGDTPKTSLWYQRASTSVGVIQNNKLNFNKTGSTEFTTHSTWRFSGDFDVEVEWSDFSRTSGDLYNRLRCHNEHTSSGMSMIQMKGGSNQYFTERLLNGTPAAFGVSASSDTSGKFRITKVGTTLTTYRWTGSWTQNFSASHSNFSGNIRIDLVLNGGGLGGVSFDNFKINSGTVVWPKLIDVFTDTNTQPPNINLWKPVVTDKGTASFGAEIQNNKLKMYLTGSTAAGGDNCFIDTFFKLSGDFDAQIDFSNLIHNNHVACGFSFEVRLDNGNHMFIKPQYSSGNNFLCRYSSGTPTDLTVSRTNTSGKIRIKRVGSTWTSYYCDGSGNETQGQTTTTIGTGDAYIRLLGYDWNSGVEASINFDDFRINSGTIKYSPAQVVWDEWYALVYHMTQDPTGGANCILDSTRYLHHGTPVGSTSSNDLVDGLIGKSIDMNGADNLIDTNFSDNYVDFSVECLFYNPGVVTTGAKMLVAKRSYYAVDENDFPTDLTIDSNGTVIFDLDAGGNFTWDTQITSTSGNLGHVYAVGTNDASATATLYIDGAAVNTGTGRDTVDNSRNWSVGGAVYSYGAGALNHFFPGNIDEVRISSIVRPAAWIKATNYSLRNDLVTCEYPIECSGTVLDTQTTLSGVVINLHRRSDGQLVNSTSPTISGTFSLTSIYPEDHYIVALHATDEYNAIVYDWINPTVSGVFI